MNKIWKLPLEKHPFTQIQLSDREKFHTGMLKLTLDVFQKDAYAAIFGEDFANDLYTADKKIKTCLEENSVDLVIKKLTKNEKGKNDVEVFAIIESKFKTGLHYSNYNGEKVSQLEKYARKNSKTEHGFVVSLFDEEKANLDISSEKKTEIHEFKLIRYTNEVLNFLNKTYSEYENPKDEYKMEFWEEIQKNPATPLITLWKSYLEGLETIVGRFENNKDLKKITSNDVKLISNIKLKGIFEGYRLKQVKSKLEKYLAKKNEDEIIKKLQSGAEIWKQPKPKNNYIILGNTHGNASMSLVMTDDRKSMTYGIQWQAGSIKVFIQPEEKINNDWSKKRESTLREISEILGGPEINNNNKESKFKSFTLHKKDILTDDLISVPEMLIDIIKKIKKIPIKII